MSKKVVRDGRVEYPRRPRWVCTLRARRHDMGLTIRQFAEISGLPSGNVGQIERGCDVCLTTAHKLAQFFGCPIADLWPRLLEGGA